MDEKGRNYDEEDVGEGVDKLSDVRRDCVVIFAPVNGRGATLDVVPADGRHGGVTITDTIQPVYLLKSIYTGYYCFVSL